MTDEQIIELCAAAGIKWIPPELPDDCDYEMGFPGSFDMVGMSEMRALLSASKPAATMVLPPMPEHVLADLQSATKYMQMWAKGEALYAPKNGYDEPGIKSATISDVKKSAKYLAPRLHDASFALQDYFAAIDAARAAFPAAPAQSEFIRKAREITAENNVETIRAYEPTLKDEERIDWIALRAWCGGNVTPETIRVAIREAIRIVAAPHPVAQPVEHSDEWRAGYVAGCNDSESKFNFAQGVEPVISENLHPDTAKLVRRFARALGNKLLSAQIKYGYSNNWQRDDWANECRAELMRHIAKGDPRDVAAYCAFLWHHDWSTAAVAQPVEQTRALTAEEIENGWHKTFSTNNPYCPCNLKSFTKAVRWAEWALTTARPASGETE